MSFDILEMWDAMKETKYRQTMEQLEQKLDEAEGSMDKAIAESLTLACEAVHAEAGSFWFYDLYGDKLIRPRAVHGSSNIGNIALKPGEGIAGSVIESGEAMIVKDCAAEPKWSSNADSKSGFTTKSMICVPILLDGQGMGCIQLLNKTDGSLFDEKDLTFETQFAKAISQQFDARGLFSAYHVDESVVVLFSGISGYSELCKKMPPQDVAQVLNEYFAFVSDHIQKHEGTFNKHFGACTMAYWCNSSQKSDAAIQACRAAMEMEKDADAFSASVKERYGCDLQFGIGIHEGPAFVGRIGSGALAERTVIGDTVNKAFALQKAADKKEILISQSVLEELSGQAKTEKVMGRRKFTKVHDDLRIFRLVSVKA